MKNETIGLGPDGEIEGRSTIEFLGTRVRVQYADAYDTFEFTCSDGEILTRSGHMAARYDAQRRILLFGSKEYELVE